MSIWIMCLTWPSSGSRNGEFKAMGKVQTSNSSKQVEVKKTRVDIFVPRGYHPHHHHQQQQYRRKQHFGQRLGIPHKIGAQQKFSLVVVAQRGPRPLAPPVQHIVAQRDHRHLAILGQPGACFCCGYFGYFVGDYTIFEPSLLGMTNIGFPPIGGPLGSSQSYVFVALPGLAGLKGIFRLEYLY